MFYLENTMVPDLLNILSSMDSNLHGIFEYRMQLNARNCMIFFEFETFEEFHVPKCIHSTDPTIGSVPSISPSPLYFR